MIFRADAVSHTRVPGLILEKLQAAGTQAKHSQSMIFLNPSLDERVSWVGRGRLQSVRSRISLMNTVGLAMRDGLAHQTHFHE